MAVRPRSITITIDDLPVEVLFGEATLEQEHECYSLAATAWGSYLDINEVAMREKHLRNQSLARDGDYRVWCLYRSDDPQQVLSTCRTVRRHFLLNDSQGTREERGCCVTLVVTALLYRSHGLASNLLRNVAQWLDRSGDAAISILYSGGDMPSFYDRLGWRVSSDSEVVLSTNTWLQNVQDVYTEIELRSLEDADITELCLQDIEILRAEAQHANAADKVARLTVLPTADLVKYQHANSDYIGDLWHGEAPQNRGTAYADEAWIYWCHDFRGRCLYIQHIHISMRDETRRHDVVTALILSAFREAEIWNFTTLATWDLRPDTRLALETLARANAINTAVREVNRAQKISIRWRDDEEKITSIVMGNETFAWNSRS